MQPDRDLLSYEVTPWSGILAPPITRVRCSVVQFALARHQ